MTDIPPIPEIPEALREASQVGKLVPFVGAGASILAGCPNWDTLATEALKAAIELQIFDHAQLDQVRNLSPRVRLSVALSLQKKFRVSIDFRKILHSNSSLTQKGQRVYSCISRIGNTFVTTNYDEWLDNELLTDTTDLVESEPLSVLRPPTRRQSYHNPKDFTADNLNENVVFHLHGSVKHPAQMIMTPGDYARHYANDHLVARENYVLRFLEHLFGLKTVLFIGYGLEELEILEYIILKAQTRDIRHFVLQGFFSHERALMELLRTHYRDCGIELLPFCKDNKGWDQLIDVLESFASQLRASSSMVLQQKKEMEALIDNA